LTEQELRDTGLFLDHPIVDEADEDGCWRLERSYASDEFDGVIREASNLEEFSAFASHAECVLNGL
jgi:hypothetical protein